MSHKLVKNSFRNFFFLLMFIFLAVFTIGNNDVFAEAGSGPGSGRRASTGYRHSAKAGATWVYYKYNGGTGDVVAPAWNHGNAVTIPSVCRKYGGFYLLVFLEYNASEGETAYTGKTGGATQLRRLNAMGGGVVYKTGQSVGDSSGEFSSVTSGEPLSSVQGKFLSMPMEARNGYSWDSNSTLGWFCYGGETGGEGSQIYSTSTVSYGEASSTSGLDGSTTMAINKPTTGTVTVKFSHHIVSEVQPNAGVDNVPIIWTTSGAGAGSNSPPNGNFYLGANNGEGWTLRPDGKWEKLVTTSVEVSLSGNATVCQTITYQPKSYTTIARVVSSSGGGSSKACATLKTINDDIPNCITDIGVTNTNSTSNVYYGQTAGNVRVKNWNNPSTFEQGTKGWVNVVFAKPGDSIQFAHCFSWGVQKVRKSDGYITGSPSDKPENPTTLTDNGHSDRTPESWFHITQETLPTKGGNYLFGLRREQGTMGSRVTLKRFESQPYFNGTSTLVKADKYQSYMLEVLSPSSDIADKTRYKCGVPGAELNLFVENKFQIPGFKSGAASCPSASNAPVDSEQAGNIFSQVLSYSKQKGWINESHKVTSGYCSCTYTDTTHTRAWTNFRNIGYAGQEHRGGAELAAGSNNGKPGNGCQSCTSTFGWYKHYHCSDLTSLGTSDGVTCEEYNGLWSDGTTDYGVKFTVNGYNNLDPGPVRYPVSFSNEQGTAKATVKVPYNFTTIVRSSISEDDVIFAGEDVTSFFLAAVVPRLNSAVKSTTSAYATTYPEDGDLLIRQFILGPGTNVSDVPKSGNKTTVGGDFCNYLAGGGQCEEISPNKDDNWLNRKGKYSGWTWSDSYTYYVPNDVEIGSKYCVAIGMTKTDSHNAPDNSDVGQLQDPMSKDTSWWNVSVSCRTIAKKPNFQAWNSNMFVDGSVDTNWSYKRNNATLGELVDVDHPRNGIFGSWEEYLLLASTEVNKFASGAALGYSDGNFGLPGGCSYSGKENDFNSYDISKMTVSNEDRIGYSKVSSNNIMLERLFARYVSPMDSGCTGGCESGISNSSPTAPLNNMASESTSSNMVYIKKDANEINTESVITRQAGSPGLVIYVTGTLNINHNICYGAGTCGSGTNSLILESRNNQTLRDISSLPQIIIVANNINIGPDVTQIDAWLIATSDINSSRGGEINTCKGFRPGERGEGADADFCNKTLIINGPVFANEIYLYRTAGAYTNYDRITGTLRSVGPNTNRSGLNDLSDDGSITPAEIFNLRPDAYLWSYHQSQNYSQATVTYTRELPPRY